MGDPVPENIELRGQDEFPALLAEVRRTRAAQHEAQRLVPGRADYLLKARKASLNALEAYASALDRHGWPLPPKMRLEIQLLRALCGSNLRRL
ncbi:hypothetical protein EKO23_15510 [Nocardioides guangzhouensis]|uniref:Uncharacterized protein n=1 Tax=Nocardioides guangzhouensis TaxID=2497878 RepID=A0A4Q4Z946_9ACTN|nr:hypothetical protein [Nocardioides guangzhouensis]RYP84430.1 hypothetical protein EKO23_15510 [Nocardioides guangzhouensis]